MMEAMSCGCAVIGSATPPVQEIIRDRDNGLRYDGSTVYPPDAALWG